MNLIFVCLFLFILSGIYDWGVQQYWQPIRFWIIKNFNYDFGGVRFDFISTLGILTVASFNVLFLGLDPEQYVILAITFFAAYPGMRNLAIKLQKKHQIEIDRLVNEKAQIVVAYNALKDYRARQIAELESRLQLEQEMRNKDNEKTIC